MMSLPFAQALLIFLWCLLALSFYYAPAACNPTRIFTARDLLIGGEAWAWRGGLILALIALAAVLALYYFVWIQVITFQTSWWVNSLLLHRAHLSAHDASSWSDLVFLVVYLAPILFFIFWRFRR